MPLVRQDSPVRPRKLPSYLVTRYPVGVDPSLSKELDGVYSARRFHQNGKPLSRIVVTWTLPDPPPPTVAFSFLPCLPPCGFSEMRVDQPTCYKCWGVGHISTYCSASEKCAWCAGPHDSRTCQHRGPPPPPPAEDRTATRASPPPADVTSNWRCPRCQEPGVNVWHGCSRPQPTAASASVPERPPHPSPLTHAVSTLDSRPASPSPPPASPSPQVLALRSAVEELKKRCAALESRLDAFESPGHHRGKHRQFNHRTSRDGRLHFFPNGGAAHPRCHGVFAHGETRHFYCFSGGFLTQFSTPLYQFFSLSLTLL